MALAYLHQGGFSLAISNVSFSVPFQQLLDHSSMTSSTGKMKGSSVNDMYIYHIGQDKKKFESKNVHYVLIYQF